MGRQVLESQHQRAASTVFDLEVRICLNYKHIIPINAHATAGRTQTYLNMLTISAFCPQLDEFDALKSMQADVESLQGMIVPSSPAQLQVG